VSRELERPSSALALWGPGAGPSITGAPGKWRAAERESEGAVVAIEFGDNITLGERRAPTSPMHDDVGRDADECRGVG
jgi:hypothetical protein